MESVLNNGITQRLLKSINPNVIYHGIFWFILLWVLIAIEGVNQGFLFTLSNELINVFFFGLIVYFNLFYLVPNYLTKKRFLTYCALLLVAAIIITPLKVIIFYFKFSNLPKLQNELITHQNWQFLITFLIAGASTVIKIITDWATQLREKQVLETQTMQSELRFLKSQINPHFLFNTLNSLYALTLKKSDDAPDIVLKLSEMMRYMLYECNEKRVLLSKEVNYIRNYIDLELLRQGKNAAIHFEVEGKVGDQQIAPLMFIPFLENSFKHGLSNQISEGFVKIKLKARNQTIDFYIENSKPDTMPIPIHGNKKSGGIGLVNVQRRLNILYPEQYELKISDTPNTYAVNLKINLD